MRIVGGEWRGRGLAAPGAEAGPDRLRPTSDRVRENLFNVLSGGRYGDPVSGVRVLDLFAGTGALGLEALSRGAAFCTFVDNGRRARALLRRNLDRFDAHDRADLLLADALKLGPTTAPPAGLVFLDPPYGRALGAAALEIARANGWIAEDALILWEENAPQSAPAGFIERERRRYGDTWVTILQAQGA